MCNEYHLRVKRGDYDWQFSEIHVPIRWLDGEANRPLGRAFKPTNRATMIRAVDPADPMAGVEGLEARSPVSPSLRGRLGRCSPRRSRTPASPSTAARRGS